MTGEDRNGVQINRVHAGAIRTEIGERLRTALEVGRPAPLPSHLKDLADLVDGVESRDALLIETGSR
jgi:hypothetical protein